MSLCNHVWTQRDNFFAWALCASFLPYFWILFKVAWPLFLFDLSQLKRDPSNGGELRCP
jgi:hypothetical protein